MLAADPAASLREPGYTVQSGLEAGAGEGNESPAQSIGVE
jgi:hypothetical protein